MISINQPRLFSSIIHLFALVISSKFIFSRIEHQKKDDFQFIFYSSELASNDHWNGLWDIYVKNPKFNKKKKKLHPCPYVQGQMKSHLIRVCSNVHPKRKIFCTEVLKDFFFFFLSELPNWRMRMLIEHQKLQTLYIKCLTLFVNIFFFFISLSLDWVEINFTIRIFFLIRDFHNIWRIYVLILTRRAVPNEIELIAGEVEECHCKTKSARHDTKNNQSKIIIINFRNLK